VEQGQAEERGQKEGVMPLLPGKKNRKKNFHELRHGKTFRRTASKFGKRRALKQMIAIELKNERGGKKMSKRGHARKRP
jgi:hypothetical protein